MTKTKRAKKVKVVVDAKARRVLNRATRVARRAACAIIECTDGDR
jgi:hypothetical protein